MFGAATKSLTLCIVGSSVLALQRVSMETKPLSLPGLLSCVRQRESSGMPSHTSHRGKSMNVKCSHRVGGSLYEPLRVERKVERVCAEQVL